MPRTRRVWWLAAALAGAAGAPSYPQWVRGFTQQLDELEISASRVAEEGFRLLAGRFGQQGISGGGASAATSIGYPAMAHKHHLPGPKQRRGEDTEMPANLCWMVSIVGAVSLPPRSLEAIRNGGGSPQP
jgi:hypothetical protein